MGFQPSVFRFGYRIVDQDSLLVWKIESAQIELLDGVR
jgi:hypothetical protein